MNLQSTELWIIIIVTAFLSYLAGFLVTKFFGKKKEEEAEGETGLAETAIKAEEPALEVKQEVQVAAPPPAPPEYDLALGHSEDGAFWVEFEGKRYTRLTELNKQIYQNIQKHHAELATWLRLPATPARSVTGPLAGVRTEPVIVPAPPETKPAPIGFVDSLSRAINPAPVSPGAPKSMVQAIDEILQARIEGTPFESRKIRLIENPGLGVVVHVGTERYVGIDAVPDPEVQALIRAAVAEWEKRAG